MKNVLIQITKERIKDEISSKSVISFITGYSVESYYDTIIEGLFLYTRSEEDVDTFPLAQICTNVGRAVLRKIKKTASSAVAAKLGGFFVYTFEELGIIKSFLARKGKHNIYVVKILDQEILRDLFHDLPTKSIEKLPLLSPPDDWTSAINSKGEKLIKTNNKDVLSITRETHPIVFDSVNRSQRIGWRVNEDVLKIAEWALYVKSPAFNDIWLQKFQAKRTKLREATTICNIADRFKDKTFYHKYQLDFRGRKYCTTTYFHEQACDLSRGLLVRKDKKPLGEEGLRWLLICLASNWANDCGREDGRKSDKIPLQDRYEWAKDNIDLFRAYATSPRANSGWTKADKPWQFLAGCLELDKAFKSGNPLTYESSLEGFLDGTINGTQHLVALTKDEVTAPYVNLVNTEFPGDLYTYVAGYVWEEYSETIANLTKDEYNNYSVILDRMIEMKDRLIGSENKEHRRAAAEEYLKYKAIHQDIFEIINALYWDRIQDQSQRRKLCKRGIMTIS